MYKTIAAVGLALAFSGCAAQAPSHSWTPGPGRDAAEFGQTSGQCKVVALASRGSHATFAPGLGSLLVLQAIDTSNEQAREQNMYDACMEARGMVAVAPSSGAQ